MMATADGPSKITTIEKAPLGRFHVRVTALCALVAALDGFDTQAIAYVAPSIGEAWNVQQSAFGPVFGAGLLGLTIGALTLGAAADRLGRKSVILLCVAMFGIFALLTAAAGNMEQLLLCRLLTGIGLGGAMPNLIAVTNEYAPDRLKATLVTIMFCGFPLGSTIGGLISAALIANQGWQSIFLLGGIIPLALLPILAWKLPESARFLVRRADAETRLSAAFKEIDPSLSAAQFIDETAKESDEKKSSGFFVIELFRERRAATTLLLWTAFFMNLLVMYFLVNWLPSLLRGNGLSLGVAITSTALLNLGGVIGALVLGRLIDRREPTRILGSAYAASAGFIILLAFAGTNVSLLLAAAALAGFGIVGGQIGLNALAASTYPTRMRATGVGWALGIGRTGSILGPVAGGVLLSRDWSSQQLLLAAVAPALLAALAVFCLRHQESAE